MPKLGESVVSATSNSQAAERIHAKATAWAQAASSVMRGGGLRERRL
jgi:hypothetical protein